MLPRIERLAMTALPNPDDALREKLAAIEHERWSDWQKWCHKILREQLRFNDMESNLEEILGRWEKQIATPYKQLSDQEKASDMEQVDRYWPLIQDYIKSENQALLDCLQAGVPEKKDVWSTDKSVDSLYKIEGHNEVIDKINATIEDVRRKL
jgi:hypothetical protein